MKTLRKRAKWIITEEERKIRSERMKRVKNENKGRDASSSISIV